MNIHARALVAATGTALLLCGTSVAHAAGAPSATGTKAASSVTVTTKNTSLGKILVNDKGHTLYLFESDKKDKSTCNDASAQASLQVDLSVLSEWTR